MTQNTKRSSQKKQELVSLARAALEPKHSDELKKKQLRLLAKLGLSGGQPKGSKH